MTQRAIVIAGFVVLFAIIVVALVVTHRDKGRVATIWATIDHLTGKRTVKIIAVLIWAWLGWHFLAR